MSYTFTLKFCFFRIKMEKNRGDVRKLLKYEFLLVHKQTDAIRNIHRAYGAGTVEKSVASPWFSKFRSGNLAVEDKQRSGRSREVDRVAVENHPSMTTRMLPVKRCRRSETCGGSVWSTHHTARISLQATIRSASENVDTGY
jgi:transposase